MLKKLVIILNILIMLFCIPDIALAFVTEYTTEELSGLELEVPLKRFYSDQALSLSSEERLDATPDKYIFKTSDKADTKEYILLKSVNASENDGYFVLTNDCTDTSSTMVYNTQNDKYVFDADDTNSIAYKINQDSYMNQHFPLMKDYINTHIWYTEPGVANAYSTNSKIALISLTEYEKNADRIGTNLGEKTQWWTRTPHNSNKNVWQFISETKKIDAGSQVTSEYSYRKNRLCFYLDESFFKEVKLDTLSMGDEVKKLFLENISFEDAKKIYTNTELVDIGYDIYTIGFTSASLDRNENILSFSAFSSNYKRELQSFTLIASVYENENLSYINKKECSLVADEDNKIICIDVDLSEFEDTKSNVTVKIFAMQNFATLIPVTNVAMDGGMNDLIQKATDEYEKVEIEIPQNYQNLNDQDDAHFNVSFIYAGNESKEYTISYTFDNWQTYKEEKVTLSYLTNIKKRVDLSDTNVGEYTLKVKVTSSDGLKKERESKFSVLKFYEAKMLDEYYDVGIGTPFDWYTHPKEHIKTLKDLGFIALRTTPSWNVTEREKGEIKVPEGSNLENNIETYAKVGMNISTLLTAYGNKYYTLEPEGTERIDMYPPIEREHIDAFVNYASLVPSILKSKDGKALSFKRYEIWNEPNLSTFWGYGTKTPDPIEYIYLMNRVSAKIKKDNPNVIIAGGALANGDAGTFNDHQEYLTKMYDLGMLKYVDEYSIHPYMYPKNPDTGYRSDGMYASLSNDYVYNLTSRHFVPRKNYGGWIDISVSEVGWPTHIDVDNANKNGYGEYGRYGTSEEDQAIYLVKTLVYNDYLGISHTDIFDGYDYGEDKTYSEHNFGIIRHDYTLKPSAFALSQYNNTCSSAQYIGRVEIADDVYGYIYQSLTKPFMILWKVKMDNTTEGDYTYTLPLGTNAEDMIGNKIEGDVINIGTEPVYVYNIPTNLVKQAFGDISIESFKDFYSYNEYKQKLDAFLKLTDMSDGDEWLSCMNDLFSFGKAVIGEVNSGATNVDKNSFMYNLFELYGTLKRMANAYAMYDEEIPSSNAAIFNTNADIMQKKNNQKETSLLFTDAIMRYAKRHNKIANEVKKKDDFVGKIGFASMNDYLSTKLCEWAALIMQNEEVDITRALLPYTKSKLTVSKNNSYILDFSLDNMLTDPFVASVYIVDEQGNTKGEKQTISVSANAYSTVSLIGDAIDEVGSYTYYVAVKYNGKVILKQPFVLTVE